MANSLVSVIALLAAAASAQPLPPPPPLEPNALAGVVDALRALASGVNVSSTGLRRASLLETIAGVVDWFVPYQDATGSIIDHDSHVEEEYATPCFAHAAATLVVHGGRADLLPPAAAALNSSIRQLSAHKCASNSCDFFAVPVMRAFALLTPLVPAAAAAAWVAGLRGIALATWEYTGQNWELTAVRMMRPAPPRSACASRHPRPALLLSSPPRPAPPRSLSLRRRRASTRAS